jgi:SNF2 family DNA or RNA helicase
MLTPWVFQTEDIEKLQKRKCAAIMSEMGTGKTLEAVELMRRWWAQRDPVEREYPDLIIVPLNTLDGWERTLREQWPEVDVVIINRKKRDHFVSQVVKRQGDVFIMHWDALRLMPRTFFKNKFGTVVADEAHRASNRKAQATLALKAVPAINKLALSGTMSGDNPLGLWSVLNWLWPTYYTSYWRFVHHYAEMELDPEKGYKKLVGLKNPDGLHREMAPWSVRHLKKDRCCEHHPEGVMAWLPDKLYSRIWVDLTPAQRRVYEQMRRDMVAWVGEHENDPLAASVVVVQMARLSQMAMAMPRLDERTSRFRSTPEKPCRYCGEIKEHDCTYIEVNLELPSSKLDALLELVADNPRKKLVVASPSKKWVYLAQQELESKGISTFALTGDTPDHARHGMARRFAEDDTRIFLGVIQAMAEGIDGLQYGTDTMVFAGRTWSTLANKQCEDRLHRGGTKNAVQIIDIMARNTVDLGRFTKLERKWELIKTILGDNAQTKMLGDL